MEIGPDRMLTPQEQLVEDPKTQKELVGLRAKIKSYNLRHNILGVGGMISLAEVIASGNFVDIQPGTLESAAKTAIILAAALSLTGMIIYSSLAQTEEKVYKAVLRNT